MSPKTILLYLSILCFALPIFAQVNKPSPKIVRFIYMVSKDRKYNAQYGEAIAMAAKSIQGWYKKQMNGYTFKLNNPIVETIFNPDTELAKFIYPNGSFTRKESGTNKAITWIEITKDKNTYPFTEKKVDDEYYYLKSTNRNIEIKIPIAGGQSFLSTDNGKTWKNLYIFEQDK